MFIEYIPTNTQRTDYALQLSAFSWFITCGDVTCFHVFLCTIPNSDLCNCVFVSVSYSYYWALMDVGTTRKKKLLVGGGDDVSHDETAMPLHCEFYENLWKLYMHEEHRWFALCLSSWHIGLFFCIKKCYI